MPHQYLDETSAKAFRAAKLRYLFIVCTVLFITLVCIGVFIYQNKQKKSLAKLAQEYAHIESLYYQENQQTLKTSSASEQNQIIDHAKSIALFRQFAWSNARNSYGWQAAIRTVNYDINNGNIQAPKELLQRIIENSYNFPLIQIKFGLALSSIYVNEGNYDDALQQIEYLEKIPKNPIEEEVKLFHAQVLYKFNKKEEASDILKNLDSDKAKIWLGYIES